MVIAGVDRRHTREDRLPREGCRARWPRARFPSRPRKGEGGMSGKSVWLGGLVLTLLGVGAAHGQGPADARGSTGAAPPPATPGVGLGPGPGRPGGFNVAPPDASSPDG